MNRSVEHSGNQKMLQKSNLIDRICAATGFAACAGLVAMLVSGPTLRPVEPAAAQTSVEQVARYRPAASEPVVQARVARNDAMTSMDLDPATLERCPRCR